MVRVFPIWLIVQSILHHGIKGIWLSKADKDFNKESEQRQEIFTWKLKLGKTIERRERIHYCQEVIVNFTELYCGYNLLDSIIFLVQEEGLFVLNCWHGGGWNDDEISITVVIFTCKIIITTAIIGAWLLEFPKKSCPTHNYSGCY